MKITKTQLQQIIKEELLREMDCDDIDDDMQSAAEDLGRSLACDPETAEGILSAIKAAMTRRGDVRYPKTAAALERGLQAGGQYLTDTHVGIED